MNGNSEAIKNFNKAVKQFLTLRNDENERQIERSLQVLAATSEISVFDPGLRDTVEFYVNLHELMMGLETSSSLAWAAVACLSEACKNPTARQCLIHTYQFLPILTRFITLNPGSDRELRILKLMEELTYGVKISWQEAHLPRLVTTLTSLVTSGSDSEKITLALSILVNVCYKNLPAVYSLMRSIDVKTFLKTVLKLQGHNESSKVQVFKLTIILNTVTAGLPEPDVNAYMKTVCPTLTSAFQKGNSSLMRQSVSFYKEMSASRNESLSESFSLHDQVESMLSSISLDDQTNLDCVDSLFEYLDHVFTSRCQELVDLYPQLLELALRWVRTEGVSTNALNLTSTIICRLTSHEDHAEEENSPMDKVLELIDQQLPVILLLLDVNGQVQTNESYQRLTALLELLSRMANVTKFSDKILSSLDSKTFSAVFQQLRLPDLQQNNLFQEPVYTFYVKALGFIQELSDKKTSWLMLYGELLSQKQVQYVLSVALYLGPEDVKLRVIQLTTTPGFSKDCMKSLASCMMELNKLVIFSPSGCKNGFLNSNEGMTAMDMTPLLTVSEEGRVDKLLEKVEREHAKNESSVTSAVMELYQFKVAAMSQTIRKMQSFQEAADKRATDLQHNLALTSSEVSRLHNLLHSTQQSYEASVNEISNLKSQIAEAQSQANDLHHKHSLAVQNLRSKTRIISELTNDLEAMKSSRDQLDNRLQKEQTDKQVLQNQVLDLEKQLESTRQSLSESEKELAHHKKELDSANRELEQLKKDYVNKTTEYSKLEKAKAEVDVEAFELNKQLTIISELAMKRAK